MGRNPHEGLASAVCFFSHARMRDSILRAVVFASVGGLFGCAASDRAQPCRTCSAPVLAGRSVAERPRASLPPKPVSHTEREIEGWKVRIDDRLLETDGKSGGGKPVGEHALRLLSNRLYEIAFILPPDKVTALREVVIQIDLAHGELTSAQYHPSREWLVEHGYSERLARAVHIPDASEWSSHRHQTVQPWSVLHELAHAYHDQKLGFGDAEIVAAWEKFRAKPRYASVRHIDGDLEPHYGCTNQMEFFAEMTEAYFGVNDFEPFNRGELMEQEPEVFALMRKIWGGA